MSIQLTVPTSTRKARESTKVQQTNPRINQRRHASAIQEKVIEKKNAFMNIIDHFTDANNKQRIFAHPFLSKNNLIIKHYLSHKTQLDPIIDKYTKTSDTAYQLLPPLIKECLGEAKKLRDKDIYINTLAKYLSTQLNYGIYIYIYTIHIYHI